MQAEDVQQLWSINVIANTLLVHVKKINETMNKVNLQQQTRQAKCSFAECVLLYKL